MERLVSAADSVGNTGALLLSAKQLHYDWLRTADAADALRRGRPALVDPPAVLLEELASERSTMPSFGNEF